MQAKVGDPAEIGGPRGSQLFGGPIAAWLLIGDETALPSIARRIEELPAGTPVISIVAVPTDADRQEIGTAADHRAIWVSRSDPTDPAPLLAALADVPLRPAQVVWIAAEVGVAGPRPARGSAGAQVAPGLGRAGGYWVAGQADAR